MRYAIGIDVGGTSAKLGLVSMDGAAAQILCRTNVPTGYQASRDTLMAGFHTALSRLIENANGVKPEGLGIGMPGLQDESGRVVDASNLPKLNGVAVSQELGAAFSLPARMDNDLNVVALGEARFGGHPPGRLLVVYIGTGIGAAMVAQGQLLTPTRGSLGDPGHILVNPNGRRCRCGALGCLEAEVSGWSMDERGGIQNAEVRDAAARWLGMALASFCVLYEPDVIVLGGQNALRGGGPFRDDVERHMKELAQPRFGNIGVRLSSLTDTAGILGAAAMILT